MVTLQNLDDVHKYHKWAPEQVDRGNAIRAAAENLSRAYLMRSPSTTILDLKATLVDAIEKSGEGAPAPSSDLRDLAARRRAKAIKMACALREPGTLMGVYALSQDEIQDEIDAVCLTVMVANSAITFEAARLEPIAPADAHSERVAHAAA